MPRAVNVILETGAGDELNLNNEGLISMTFDRYLGTPRDSQSEFLSRIDLTLFDRSGYRLLSLIQQSNATLRVKYGFSDNMSEVFSLNIVKFKSTFNNLGCMVSIGAIGTLLNPKFPATYYPRDISIEKMLIEFAKRNNWDIGDYDGSHWSSIDCNLTLPWEVYKPADMSDIDFIKEVLLPICNKSVKSPENTLITDYWDWKLYKIGATTYFNFLPFGTRTVTQRVWQYAYGESLDSSVISVTNTIDYSFLLRGLHIKIPSTFIESTIMSEETIKEEVKSLIVNQWDDIKSFLLAHNLPAPSINEFAFRVELVDAEDAGETPLEDRIVESIKNAVYSINTIDLTVIGNPKILPTDIIDLTVMNKPENGQPFYNIVSGRWRVVTIREEIGLSGYKTTLGLVREKIITA